MESIGRPSLVAMQPGPITPEADQVSERDIRIVPHGRYFNPSAYADGTDLIAHLPSPTRTPATRVTDVGRMCLIQERRVSSIDSVAQVDNLRYCYEDRANAIHQNARDGETVMKVIRRSLVLSVIPMLLLAGSLRAFTGSESVQTDPAFNAFWIKFKAAVARNDKARVADMTKLPFRIADHEYGRDAFIRKYNSLFTAKVRRCIARAKPMKDRDIYEIFCGEEIFIFANVNGTYKFTEIGAND
jgi:hypothetical protein